MEKGFPYLASPPVPLSACLSLSACVLRPRQREKSSSERKEAKDFNPTFLFAKSRLIPRLVLRLQSSAPLRLLLMHCTSDAQVLLLLLTWLLPDTRV